MKKPTVVIKWSLRIGLANAEQSDEYDTGLTREEWDNLDEDGKQAIVREVVFQYVEWDFHEV